MSRQFGHRSPPARPIALAPPRPPEPTAIDQGLELLQAVVRWLQQHAALIEPQIPIADLLSPSPRLMQDRHQALLHAVRAKVPADYDITSLMMAVSVLERPADRDVDAVVFHLLALECLIQSFYVSERIYLARTESYRRMVSILGPFLRRHPVSAGAQRALGPIAEDLRDVGLTELADALVIDSALG